MSIVNIRAALESRLSTMSPAIQLLGKAFRLRPSRVRRTSKLTYW